MGFEGFSPDSSFKSIEKQKNEAKRFLSAVVKHLSDSTIKTSVLDGKTSEAILQYAGEYKADLIVMGVHSHNGFWKIIKHAEIPVLIVPVDKQDLGMVSKKQNTLQHI
jgi:nucleotide-binding universal stress UspA family protein